MSSSNSLSTAAFFRWSSPPTSSTAPQYTSIYSISVERGVIPWTGTDRNYLADVPISTSEMLCSRRRQGSPSLIFKGFSPGLRKTTEMTPKISTFVKHVCLFIGIEINKQVNWLLFEIIDNSLAVLKSNIIKIRKHTSKIKINLSISFSF